MTPLLSSRFVGHARDVIMKINLLLALVFCFATTAFTAPDIGKYQVPAGALVIETQSLAPNRELVLWMLKPTKHPRETPDELYTCPEYTRGSYYSGATRVSLVNTQTHRIINTVKILTGDDETADEFDLPYNIRSDFYYHVEGVPKESEGKPTIMWLKDYNGDGKALEFALFDAQACMGLSTTLIGYSERQDKVIQYPTHLSLRDSKGKQSTKTEHWVDYLFSKKPMSPGVWKYEIDYRGRAGELAQYEVHYNKQAERFEGKLVETGGE
jgi:hypothetical protein